LTLYYSHPASLEHRTGAHPENPERLRAIEAALAAAGPPGLDKAEPPRATREQLERAHGAAHIAAIEDFCAAGGGMIDMDTVASEGSFEAALRAAGGACEAAERLLAGEDRAAFCGLRPPGHHAERDRAMGFCLFNNVAVAAEHAIQAAGADRVLVCDWDVHHGNGTEAIFRESDRVLYTSIHQSPLYPGTGDASYEGEGRGEGYTINLPVPPGADSEVFAALVQHVVVPVAHAFDPQLVAISAGYDAHRADPLASCLVDEEGYRTMAASLAQVGKPVLVCLEGGYDPGALARSVVATLEGLVDPEPPAEADPAPAAEHRARVARRWPL
jgi:acetoin utilization deacetylase AcuC-like enzyme